MNIAIIEEEEGKEEGKEEEGREEEGKLWQVICL
jgi:hypothetical protein